MATPTVFPVSARPLQARVSSDGNGSKVVLDGVDISDCIVGLEYSVTTVDANVTLTFPGVLCNVSTADAEGEDPAA